MSAMKPLMYRSFRYERPRRKYVIFDIKIKNLEKRISVDFFHYVDMILFIRYFRIGFDLSK